MCCQPSLHSADKFYDFFVCLFHYSYCMWDQPGFVFSPAITLGLLDCFAFLLETDIMSVFVLLFWYINFFYIFKCTTHLTQLPFNSGNSTAALKEKNYPHTIRKACLFIKRKQTAGLYQM